MSLARRGRTEIGGDGHAGVQYKTNKSNICSSGEANQQAKAANILLYNAEHADYTFISFPPKHKPQPSR
jgi:hypothetical protein